MAAFPVSRAQKTPTTCSRCMFEDGKLVRPTTLAQMRNEVETALARTVHATDFPAKVPAKAPVIHTILIAPYFGENMRHCLRCFADLPDCKLGVLSQEPEDKLPPEVRGKVAAFQRIGDPATASNILDGARAIQAQWGRIDRLEGYLEMLQVPIAEARDALGIDGMRTEAAKNFRDKNRMKDVLRAAGVPVARQALVRNAEDARAFVKEVGYPIVLKPIAGLGARNTQRAHDNLTVVRAQRAAAIGQQPRADQGVRARRRAHVRNRDDGETETVWSSSTEYVPSPLEVLENQWMQYTLIMPREMDPPHVRAFADINTRALQALGMQNGLSHMEWFLREDGSMVVSEVGARPPGANVMPMLAAAHGADPWAAWAQLMVHRTWHMPARQYAAGSVFLRAMGGADVVRGVEGIDKLRNCLAPRWST